MISTVTSRQNQILQLLLNNREGQTIDEISQALEISRSAVQQHFTTLEKNDFITTATLNKTAGRPVRSYVITKNGINQFPKQYDWFSEIIISDLKQEMGENAFKRYLRKLGVNLAHSLLHDFNGKTVDERLKQLIATMDELGFQTKTTISSNEQNIEACNCIYHNLAQQHHEICEFDKALISTLLDKDVELDECMAKGGHICRFKIKSY